jgi:uncharacterized membrane protein
MMAYYGFVSVAAALILVTGSLFAWLLWHAEHSGEQK